MTWFVDKLGPSPTATPAKPGARQDKRAAEPPRKAAPTRAAPAPEPPKKKKGWF